MEVQDIDIMLVNAKETVNYNVNAEYLERILVCDDHIRIVRNRFKNKEGQMVEEAIVYPMQNIEYYVYIEVGV